jgi:hypothetical protein
MVNKCKCFRFKKLSDETLLLKWNKLAVWLAWKCVPPNQWNDWNESDRKSRCQGRGKVKRHLIKMLVNEKVCIDIDEYILRRHEKDIYHLRDWKDWKESNCFCYRMFPSRKNACESFCGRGRLYHFVHIDIMTRIGDKGERRGRDQQFKAYWFGQNPFFCQGQE